MLPASNRGAGQNIGFPDVCNTPVGPATAPIPYPNIAMNAQAASFSPVVKVSMVNALNQASVISMTTGDEAGVAHPMIKGPGKYTMGNPLVSIDRMPAINLTCPTTGNGMNNGLGAVLVPSAVNVLYCERGASLRDFIETPPCETQLLPGNVLRLRIDRLSDEVRMSADGKPDALVLDLTGCRGGDLDAALRLLSHLLPDGSVVGELSESDGDVQPLKTRGRCRMRQPVVVVVSRDTASAAELVAAALQDHKRALIVGQRTYGKRTAYRLAATPAGAPHLVSAGMWQRHDSSATAHHVVPDVPCAPESALKQGWALALQLASVAG